MWRHKSLGLLTAFLVAPRLVYRISNRMSYKLEELPGNSLLESVASKVVHYGLYAFMIVMPSTGIAMGYYGGKGLPFFWTSISSPVPGNDAEKKKNGEIAKKVNTTMDKWEHKLNSVTHVQHFFLSHFKSINSLECMVNT
jgi:cytochrome b561